VPSPGRRWKAHHERECQNGTNDSYVLSVPDVDTGTEVQCWEGRWHEKKVSLVSPVMVYGRGNDVLYDPLESGTGQVVTPHASSQTPITNSPRSHPNFF
jgi:hypothetical protein